MSDPVASLSVVSLFQHADDVVKGVLVLLLVASVWSWAVIIDRLWRIAAARRSVEAHEKRLATAQSAAELTAPSGRRAGTDAAGLVIDVHGPATGDKAFNLARFLVGDRDGVGKN